MTPVMIALTLVVAAPAPKEAPKKDAPSLVGEWIAAKVVAGGKEIPAGQGLDGFRITFAVDGTLAVRVNGREAQSGTYKADPKKDPPEIDLTPPADKNEPPSLGIYKLDGDTLMLCLGSGKDSGRPTTLESPDGTPVVLMTLKRAKKD